MSIAFDPAIFATLGIAPDANSMDNPKPPIDGTYTVNLKLAPIPLTQTKDGKEVAKSKIVAGVDYAGKAIAPQGDPTSLRADEQGRANFTLYVDAEILNDSGRRIRTVTAYVTSNARNGSCQLFDLARVIVETYGPTALDLTAAIQKYNDPSKTPNMVWLGVAEAIEEFLKGNPTGVHVPAFISTNLLKDTGEKDSAGYNKVEVKAYGSEKIQKLYPEYWTGDKLEDGWRLETTVKGFRA